MEAKKEVVIVSSNEIKPPMVPSTYDINESNTIIQGQRAVGTLRGGSGGKEVLDQRHAPMYPLSSAILHLRHDTTYSWRHDTSMNYYYSLLL